MTDHSPRPDRLAIVTPSDKLLPNLAAQMDVRGHSKYRGDNLMAKLPQDDRIASAFYLAMKTKEEWLIEKAFAKAAGTNEPYPQINRQELIEQLSEDYTVFGLASGPKSAEELIRRLESAANRQGLQQRGGNGIERT